MFAISRRRSPPPSRRRARDHGTASRAVAIVLPSLVPDDATGNDALGMRQVLTDAGYEVALFAGRIGGDLPGDLLAAAPDWIHRRAARVVYHLASGWAAGRAFLQRTSARVVVRDHNITPAAFFDDVNDEFAAAARSGEAERQRLANDPRVGCWLACSPFSAASATGLGADPAKVRVAAPLHPLEQLESAAPDLRRLRAWTEHPADALFVGRFAPNKGHLQMLAIAAHYRELFGRAPRLRLVGRFDPRLWRWRALLDQECTRLGLGSDVEIIGEVDLATLKAAYLTSHAFLCCSEHEGFCIPLVEAGALGVPVVATDRGAVASTLAPDAAVLRDASADEIAVALHRVLNDPALRDRLVQNQRAHVRAHFAAEVVARQILAALETC